MTYNFYQNSVWCLSTKIIWGFNLFYFRDNPDGQQLNRSEPHMIESTTFNVDDPIKVIVHGWMGTTQEKEGLCSYNVKCKSVKYFFSLINKKFQIATHKILT